MRENMREHSTGYQPVDRQYYFGLDIAEHEDIAGVHVPAPPANRIKPDQAQRHGVPATVFWMSIAVIGAVAFVALAGYLVAVSGLFPIGQ